MRVHSWFSFWASSARRTTLHVACGVALGLSAIAPNVAAFDHAAAIAALKDSDLARGQKLYAQHCVACHGADGNLAQNPLARRFAQDELKFGADPYSLWKTISYGNGLMFRWDAVLTETQRYQLVHYIREAFLRQNGSQYIRPESDYYEKLAARAEADARIHGPSEPTIAHAHGVIDGKMGQAMIYGPAQSHSVVFAQEIDPDATRSVGTPDRVASGSISCAKTTLWL